LKVQGYVNLTYPPEMLRSLLDNVLGSLSADGHVGVNAVWESFSKYPYLPRLAGIDVVGETVRQAVAPIPWQQQGWAVAAGYDPGTDRYTGLDAGSFPAAVTGTNLIVRPERARAQLGRPPSQASPDQPGSTLAAEGHPGGNPAAAPRLRHEHWRTSPDGGERRVSGNRPLPGTTCPLRCWSGR
jgi:hypothetical protein